MKPNIYWNKKYLKPPADRFFYSQYILRISPWLNGEIPIPFNLQHPNFHPFSPLNMIPSCIFVWNAWFSHETPTENPPFEQFPMFLSRPVTHNRLTLWRGRIPMTRNEITLCPWMCKITSYLLKMMYRCVKWWFTLKNGDCILHGYGKKSPEGKSGVICPFSGSFFCGSKASWVSSRRFSSWFSNTHRIHVWYIC